MNTDSCCWQVKPRAHDGSVVACAFFKSQPLMITSGTDNALKIWIFDQVQSSFC